LLLAAWLLGMIIVAARWIWSYATYLQLLPKSLSPDHEWATELHRISAELRLTRPIPLHVTEQLGPALCLTPAGYALLVPRLAWSRFSSQQRRAILRHELAHYVRGDLWKSLLARILAWPQWFNPLAWLAVRNFDAAAECACDDVAVAAEQEVAFDYLRALLDLGTTEVSASALQVAVHGGSLQSRVRRLLSPTGKDSVMKTFVVVVAVSALAAGGLMRIELASAQLPAPLAPISAVARDPGSPDPTPHENSTVEPVDAPRLASATSAKPSQEAFIDLTRAFKEVHAIHGRLMELNKGIRAFDVEVKEEQLRLQSLAETRKTTADPAEHLRIDSELTEGQRKLQERANQLREQCLKDEAKIYHDGFEQIRKATAEYARQHGIRVVRRSQSTAYAEEKAADEQVDVTDRKAVLARVNRPVIFFDGPSETPTDITDAIVERLNRTRAR
jgi:Skp family chaperone for outer membrane proteins